MALQLKQLLEHNEQKIKKYFKRFSIRLKQNCGCSLGEERELAVEHSAATKLVQVH